MDTLKEFLTSQFKEFSAQAVDLKRKIGSAKTSLKKDYFNKKLQKINKKVYAIMLELAIMDAKANPTPSSEKSNEI